MTKVLVSTKETQGKRCSDFSHVPEGEIVQFPMIECSNESIDGGCGCRRSMSGVETHKATTTMKIMEMDLDPEELYIIIKKSLKASGWPVGRETILKYVKELLEFAEQFEVGDLVERRGSRLKKR